MYGNNQVYYYLRQVDSYLRSQQDQLNKIKEELKELREKISAREPQTTHIEKIEYKFDQLKIETLEGTLNIGLAPNGMADPEAFENFSVNQTAAGNLPILQKYPDIYQRIKDNIQQYLMSDCPLLMNEIATKHNIYLNDQHRAFIIHDIERQLDERVHHYLGQIPNDNRSDKNPEYILHYVLTEIQKDIANSIDTFIKHMPKGGNF